MIPTVAPVTVTTAAGGSLLHHLLVLLATGLLAAHLHRRRHDPFTDADHPDAPSSGPDR